MTDLEKYGVDRGKGRKYESIVYTLALIYGKYEKCISEYLSEYGMTIGKFNILMAVRYVGKEEGVSQVAIKDRLIVSAGNITTLAEKLVKDGLISRKQNPESRRENIIKITKKGTDLIEKIWPRYNELIEDMANKIPKKEHEYFSKILAQWYSNLSEVK